MTRWKDVPGYKGLYKISDDGKVFGLKRNKIVSICVTQYGYTKVGLYKNGKRKHISVHRLVALAFIPNINNYKQVNHIDENKLNNCVSNLEWCSAEKNVNHGTRTIRASNSCKKIVEQVDFAGNVVNTFYGLSEAADSVGAKKRNIGACCEGYQKSAKGYYWRYKESEESK